MDARPGGAHFANELINCCICVCAGLLPPSPPPPGRHTGGSLAAAQCTLSALHVSCLRARARVRACVFCVTYTHTHTHVCAVVVSPDVVQSGLGVGSGVLLFRGDAWRMSATTLIPTHSHTLPHTHTYSRIVWLCYRAGPD